MNKFDDAIQRLFDDPNEYKSFHDCVWEYKQVKLSVQDLKDVFESLPLYIQATAYIWGLSDTVFRDDVSVFLRSEQNK